MRSYDMWRMLWMWTRWTFNSETLKVFDKKNRAVSEKLFRKEFWNFFRKAIDLKASELDELKNYKEIGNAAKLANLKELLPLICQFFWNCQKWISWNWIFRTLHLKTFVEELEIRTHQVLMVLIYTWKKKVRQMFPWFAIRLCFWRLLLFTQKSANTAFDATYRIFRWAQDFEKKAFWNRYFWWFADLLFPISVRSKLVKCSANHSEQMVRLTAVCRHRWGKDLPAFEFEYSLCLFSNKSSKMKWKSGIFSTRKRKTSFGIVSAVLNCSIQHKIGSEMVIA